jgi:Uma2 family endonuclease
VASSPTEMDLRFHAGPWTEADYLSMPDDRARIELLDGGLFVNPAPGTRHQRLSLRICMALEAARPAGMEMLEAVNIRVAPGRILIPDVVAVTRPGEDRAVLDAGDVALVIEIVSPSSVAAERAIKPQLYAAAGIATYVRIEMPSGAPTGRTFHLEGGTTYVAASDAPAGSMLRLTQPFQVELDLAALLERPRPSA